jgi:L-amino acid N-acyltransferase YncA
MLIRRAVDADWPGIWPLWHRVVASGETYMWTPSTTEPAARAAWMLPAPAVVYVVEDGPGIVATAQLRPNQPGLGDHVANAAFMVDPDHAGRGIGRRVAEYVLEEARLRGYRSMQFNAVVATNEAAIRLWRSLGFRVLGTVPAAFRHRTRGLVDVHVMFREL